MVWLFRFLLGFVEFEFFGGFYEDFLTRCFKDGVEIKETMLTDGGFKAVCSIKTYKQLHKIALKNGGKVRILKKKGLPFLLLPLKNRLGFFTGALAFVVIISFLGGFVWNVELVGNERVSDAELGAFLDKNGVKSGVMWSGIDREKIAWEMMGGFSDIAWAHINKIGTTARVEINETNIPPEKDNGDSNKLQGITVFRKQLEVVTSREQSKIKTEKQKTYKTILFFGAKIPLYLNKEKGVFSDSRESKITIRDTELPVGCLFENEKWIACEKVLLTDAELLELSKKRLRFEEEKAFDSYEIINKTTDFSIDESKCVITASYIVKSKE